MQIASLLVMVGTAIDTEQEMSVAGLVWFPLILMSNAAIITVGII